MDKPLILDLPYPTLDKITEDVRSAMIISPAYAGGHGELNAIMQYVYHYVNSSCISLSFAKTLMQIAIAEMKHLTVLGEVLYRLGVNPVFTEYPFYKWNYYSTRSVSYSRSQSKIIMDNLTLEITSINEYKKIIKELKNERVSSVISRIILDEELHVKVLKEILKEQNES